MTNIQTTVTIAVAPLFVSEVRAREMELANIMESS